MKNKIQRSVIELGGSDETELVTKICAFIAFAFTASIVFLF